MRWLGYAGPGGPLASFSYSRDAVGNVTSKTTSGTTTTYTYDALSRLLSAATTAYAYDAAGLRVRAGTGASTTSTLWDRARGAGAGLGGLGLPVSDGTNAFHYGPSGVTGQAALTGGSRTHPGHRDGTCTAMQATIHRPSTTHRVATSTLNSLALRCR